jgi:hypothetical protein
MEDELDYSKDNSFRKLAQKISPKALLVGNGNYPGNHIYTGIILLNANGTWASDYAAAG